MPRPKKQRRCEGRCCGRSFKPTGTPMVQLQQIPLFRDELEALALCDRDGLFQEQAAERMGVSRGTVQRILSSARRKAAQALTTGAALIFVDAGPAGPEAEEETAADDGLG
ncbi:MAG: DNA-binding protein [Desulfobulbaceae bacterium A2]|nr:MAG: DNA-binding protein [Desulfobulbaceae bacterium A2]